MTLNTLLSRIRACRLCEAHLPLGPRPVVQLSLESKILIIAQAPGTRVHASGIPFDDASGDRLRGWMGIDKETFYNDKQVAILPMGFCYPGRGKGGDLPPRKECAPHWHDRIFPYLKNVRLTLLIGSYAQNYYMKEIKKKNLTETVRSWKEYQPREWPLVHPSPRNQFWLLKNPWFETELVPALRARVREIL